MKRVSPLKKKKLKPKSGRSEPTRRIGQPRLRGRAPGNRHGEAEVLGSAAGEEETKEGPHNLQLPVLRGKEDGRSRAVSFFAPPPLPSAPQPAGRRSFTRFGPSVKSSDCPPSTWLTLPTRRNGVLLLLNSKTCVCSRSLALSRRKYKLKVATVKCRSCKIQWSCKITCETSFLCPPRATSDPADPVNRSPVP